MFDYSRITEGQVALWVELDGMEVEVVLTQHKDERQLEREILESEVLETLVVMENVILDMRDGDQKKIVCNATGVTVVVGTHAISEGKDFWLRVFVITTYRNPMYNRIGFYREGK